MTGVLVLDHGAQTYSQSKHTVHGNPNAMDPENLRTLLTKTGVYRSTKPLGQVTVVDLF